LGALLSEGGDSLAPYIGKILTAISGAFAKYQARNMLSLFDTVACLAGPSTSCLQLIASRSCRGTGCCFAEVMGTELQRPEYSRTILSPLVARWNTASDDDEMLVLPLVKCLVFVAAALGPAFAPFAPEVYTRYNSCNPVPFAELSRGARIQSILLQVHEHSGEAFDAGRRRQGSG
jgi:transportin-1